MTSALIVDDEANLVEHLVRLLGTCWPELEIVGRAYNGREALAKFNEEMPDIVFLDIRMPGLSGLDVATEISGKTKIVFTTAFDEYAVQAFEAAATDYLLKPITADRLNATVTRLQGSVTRPPGTELQGGLQELLEQLRTQAPQHLQWLRAGDGDDVQLVPVADVVYFKSDQKYTSVFTEHTEHLVRTSIKDLELSLDSTKFWRIHRGIIVNVGDILSARRDFKGRYSLTLRRRPETLRSSQSYGHLFKLM